MRRRSRHIASSGVLGEIEGVGQKRIEIDQIQDPGVRRLQEQRRRDPGLVGLLPAHRAQTPAIAITQTRKVVGRHWRDQVVSPFARKRQKPVGNTRADDVGSHVVIARMAVAVAQVAGVRFTPAQFKVAAQGIARRAAHQARPAA